MTQASKTQRSDPTLMLGVGPRTGRILHPLKEAAQRLGLTVWGLRAWVYAGKIASHKIGSKVCISEDEIARIIAESERPASVAHKRTRKEE
jgi:excisionase family DNA binding protein